MKHGPYLLLITLLVVAIALIMLHEPEMDRTPINQANFRRICTGMSETEVERVFEGPPRVTTDRKTAIIDCVMPLLDDSCFTESGKVTGDGDTVTRAWMS